MAALPSPPADPQPSGPLAGADEPPAGQLPPCPRRGKATKGGFDEFTTNERCHRGNQTKHGNRDATELACGCGVFPRRTTARDAPAVWTTRRAACSCGQLHLTIEGDTSRISMCHC